MECHRVTSRATVSSIQQPVIICLVCHRRVLSVCLVPIEVFQVNSQYDIISGCQTVEIFISEPKLAFQISKPIL